MILDNFLDVLTITDNTVIVLKDDFDGMYLEGGFGDFWNCIRPYGKHIVKNIEIRRNGDIYITLEKFKIPMTNRITYVII